MIIRPSTLVLLGAALPACAPDSTDRAHRFALTDSAGITVATNAPGTYDAAPAWSVDSAPALDIGVVEGDSAYQLFGVTGARRLADGGIAVMNSGTHQLRVYDRAGTHQFSAGRRGEGPGEFVSPYGVWLLPGDSLVAFDERLQRISVFTRDGRFARQARIQRGALNANLLTALRDGSFITFDQYFSIPEQGFAPIDLHLARWSAAGAFLDSLGRHPFAEMGHIGGETGYVGSRIFAPQTVTAGNGAHFWIGTTAEPEITMHGPDGQVVRVIRWHIADRAVGEADLAAYRTERLRGVPDDRRAFVERQLAATPVLDRFPAYQWLLATADGHLWVRDYDRPGPEPALRWTLFSPEGAILARLALPSRFLPFDGGPDWLLGVERDGVDVEHVRLYRVTPNPGAPGFPVG